MPAATYPGTVTPLRGLNAFAESERDVLFGRDRERDELARLVTSEGFRAGLVYGEPGVGKTSLLRAGVTPDLRDHGVVALFCDDHTRPIDSFALALGRATGASPSDREDGATFLGRVVGQAMAGQMYLFIIDEVGLALGTGDDRIISEIGDLFARVVTRSGGRARFLFSCASDRVHRFGLLERRTGSLFPPSSRFELSRFSPADAVMVLERTVALAGIACQQELAPAIVESLARRGPILPADLQICALAIGTLGVTSPAELDKLGGAQELERGWITAAAAATGNERSALRLLAELSYGEGAPVFAPQWAAARASLDPGFAYQALQVLHDRGVVRGTPVAGTEELHFSLAHEILCSRVREVAAPARLSARRAFDLLGSKAQQGKRLSLREWWEVRREGIAPSTREEHAVLHRTVRLAKIAIAVAAALPVVLLILIYVSMSGSYYLDVDDRGGADRVVVRAGKAGLSAFDWLPASPGFGDVVADTGLSRPMVTGEAWSAIVANEIAGDLDGEAYAKATLQAARPVIAGLIAYAADGGESALESLRRSAESEGDIVALLEALRPIARGNPQEVAFVEQSLADASPAVQTAALGVAAGAAARHSDAYDDVLAKALGSDDAELRRLALSTVRQQDDEVASKLYGAALARGPAEAARRELLALVAADDTTQAPSASSATAILATPDVEARTRAQARALLERAFISDPAEASRAAAELVANEKAKADDRITAIQLVLDFAPKEVLPDLAEAVAVTMKSSNAEVRAAVLPLFARVEPKAATVELVKMLDDKSLPPSFRVALALGWGEIARTGDRAAQGALEAMITEKNNDVRAAAARAYGNVGRASQSALVEMVKKEYYDVAVGAAEGLANSADAGGSAGVAVRGIRDLWKKKGRARRAAAEVYARMARSKAGSVFSYLTQAARASDDDALHPIGVEGLCNALGSGYSRAGRELARSADDPSLAVRRLIIECVIDHPKDTRTAQRVAQALIGDGDEGIRADAARVLASLAARDPSEALGQSLARLARDADRDVRVIAIRALASLGPKAPKAAIEALPRAFEGGDESEKLAVLAAARRMGAAGLVPLAIADESPLVRTAAISTAIATGANVSSTLNSALTDSDVGVRRAALELLAEGKHGMSAGDVAQALALASRDRSPEIASLALTTLARLGDPQQIETRLGAGLRSRSEKVRARAAAAARGLAEHDPKTAEALLVPLLDDPSHDVRAAMLPSLARALAGSRNADELGAMLASSETRSTRRLVITAAFVMLAQTEGGKDAALAALEEVAKSGPPLGAVCARVGIGLVSSSASGVEFLAKLVP